ncbi:MAG: phosphopantetheine-binding protein [Anaerolineae bacterium]
MTAKVLAIVSEATGYPVEMLELDLDMEADLGIDTVKQAETFAAIRQAFDIPRRDDLKLRDYPTLAKVIGFVRLAAQRAAVPPAVAVTEPAPGNRNRAGHIEQITGGGGSHPAPRARAVAAPAAGLVQTDWRRARRQQPRDRGARHGWRRSRAGQPPAKARRDRPRSRGSPDSDKLEAQVKTWLSEGAIQGVYWLTALDVWSRREDMNLELWRELNRQRVKNLSITMRALYDAVSAAGAFLVTGTRLGGLHGYGADGATAPLGRAVVALPKPTSASAPPLWSRRSTSRSAADGETRRTR